jgi:hypothetical protein
MNVFRLEMENNFEQGTCFETTPVVNALKKWWKLIGDKGKERGGNIYTLDDLIGTVPEFNRLSLLTPRERAAQSHPRLLKLPKCRRRCLVES